MTEMIHRRGWVRAGLAFAVGSGLAWGDDQVASDWDATPAVSGVFVNDTSAVACDPSSGSHAGCFSEYTGPEVCVACHADQARAMHGSVHYQQNGPTDFVPNIPGLGGERGFDFAATGINTYCGTHENSPRFTCAGCHVGNGRFPVSTSLFDAMDAAQQLEQLANIDCLTCHQEAYERFPDPASGFEDLVLQNVRLDENGLLVAAPGQSVIRTGLEGIPTVDPITRDFDFVPADPTNPALASIPGALMTMTALEAALTVHPTTRQSCLNCHASAAGADGAKRGDLSSANANPTAAIDHHMSPEGQNMTCSDCHDAGNHRVRGRGLDLRANDVEQRFTCENSGCHSASPHVSTVRDGSTTRGTRLNRHTPKVACQTCHIPTYAKSVATEVSRDWQDPHVGPTACNGRGGWLPREDKASNLLPSYAWFDGNSEVYVLGEDLDGVPTVPLPASISTLFLPNAGTSAENFDPGDPTVVLGAPIASLAAGGQMDLALGASNAAAKIYPMKEHWGKLARHTESNTLIAHSTFEFFRTGDFDFAVLEGMAASGMSGDYTVVPVHTFQTINHGVEVMANALQCGACHASLGGGPLRMNLPEAMGYALDEPATATGLCNNCHGAENNPGLLGIHDRNAHRNRGCSACHTLTGR